MGKRGVTKVKLSISLDSELHSKLKQYCDDNMIKLSTYIEHLIKKGQNGSR